MLSCSILQYSLTFGAPNLLSFDMSSRSGLGSLSLTIPSFKHLLRIRGSASGGTSRAPPAAPVASAAAAPGGRCRRGAHRRPRQHGGVRPRGRGSGDRLERGHSSGRADPVQSAALAPGFCTRIPLSSHRIAHLWRRRGADHRCRACLRGPLPARISASASAS